MVPAACRRPLLAAACRLQVVPPPVPLTFPRQPLEQSQSCQLCRGGPSRLCHIIMWHMNWLTLVWHADTVSSLLVAIIVHCSRASSPECPAHTVLQPSDCRALLVTLFDTLNFFGVATRRFSYALFAVLSLFWTWKTGRRGRR